MYPDYPAVKPAVLGSDRQELARLRAENEALRQRLKVYEDGELAIEAHKAQWGHLRRAPLRAPMDIPDHGLDWLGGER